MDPFSSTIGISSLATRQPKSLIEWHAQHETQSLRHDWWFKAGATVIRMHEQRHERVQAMRDVLITVFQFFRPRTTALKGAHR
jgi:hypothetical protein